MQDPLDKQYGHYSRALFELPQNGKVIAEYVWTDGSGIGYRSKCRTLEAGKYHKAEDYPLWNYDGSSCYQATTEDSEVTLKPVAVYRDPFRRGDNVIVLCESWNWEDKTWARQIPANTNFRHFAKQIWDDETVAGEETWYGIEQEYTLLSHSTKFTKQPLGWPNNGYPGNQGPYYCSNGANVAFGRAIADAHYKACLYAGVTISGTNLEVMPGQLEYQIGPCKGIQIGDDMVMGRFLLHRVAEDFQIDVSFAPKLFSDWNGSGCHCNFSTKTMRDGSKGWEYIENMMKEFDRTHKLHISLYGEDNHMRLTGIHETSSVDKFSWGTGNRAASFRIPTDTHKNKKGYIEDRRPASNIDPYVVGAIIADTSILGEKTKAGPMLEHYNKWNTWRKTAQIEKID